MHEEATLTEEPTFHAGIVVARVGFVFVQAHAADPVIVDDGPTYALSDFKITYPYDDPRPDIPPNETVASVRFVSHWPTSGYPGYANCTMTLVSGTGDTVASFDFAEISGTDDVVSGPLMVPVTGAPASGTGTCKHQTGQDATGSGYVVKGPTHISAERDFFGKIVPDRSLLTFDVQWAGDADPGMRTCYLSLSRTDGTSMEPTRFTLLDGNGPLTLKADLAPEEVGDARVDCGPFDG